MGRFITIEDALGHNAAHADDRAEVAHDLTVRRGAVGADTRLRAQSGLLPRVFDLHCDTLDRLALSGDPLVVAHDLTVRRGAVGADTRLRAQSGLLPRVFDLHCDTLDRLALSGDPLVPGGFYEHDKGVLRERMSSLRDNDAHISLERTAEFDWCQCFAVFIPDELRGMDAWRFYERVSACHLFAITMRIYRLSEPRNSTGASVSPCSSPTSCVEWMHGAFTNA